MGSPFSSLARTPTAHFRLVFYASLTCLLERAFSAFGTPSTVLDQFPFLSAYLAELPDSIREPLQARGAVAWWSDNLDDWERASRSHLPLRALRTSLDLDHESLMLLFVLGLVDDDARFGPLFEALQDLPGQRRPVFGTMNGWWRGDDPDLARTRVRRLIELGLVHLSASLDTAPERTLHVPGPIWDALHGDAPTTPLPWLKVTGPDQTPDLDDLILPDSIRSSLPLLPSLLKSGEVGAVVVRGPRRNGRRTLLRALARSIGLGTIEIGKRPAPGDDFRRIIGPLATLGHSMPLFVLDLAPGETAELPALAGYNGPIGVILGRQGGLSGEPVERAVTFSLPVPDPHARRRHWSAAFGSRTVEGLDLIGDRFRMTVGHIHRAAALASTGAALDGRDVVTPSDAQQASRALNRQTLDTLATRIETPGEFDDLAVRDETRRQLLSLVGRCRHRERLAGSVGPILAHSWNCGVRALFSGPSGTGKTLAARLLASALQMDLYRIDLASVVNKYIGETEKNLDQVFAHAEELDVILLLDEGDALLTQRTNVQTSNDRYANLETNYLLQRLETFEGILIVTTNAGDRIDSAFKRRLDVVVDFHPPEPSERWMLWDRHLPESHRVDPRLLQEIASRCPLTGGQIRNAVLHAAVLALEDGQVLLGPHLEAAVQLEYHKQGAVCPLRRRP